ncbi:MULTISPECIES: hypothetical protein [Hungatella]|uniref:hypothetical protein n=1 Tax=Hungatella TaxID=1649459 RepID=UPI002673EAEB|nr:hypothetical protein [Hungatella hathewayi]
MKIYNKKKFGSGFICIVLGVLNFLACFSTGFDVSGMVITLALLFIGGGSVMRSFSRNMSREDKLDELDERNRLIDLKTKSRAFRLTQAICFGLMLLFLVMGKMSGEILLISAGVGLAFAYAVSMFTEIFTYFYYEKHN